MKQNSRWVPLVKKIVIGLLIFLILVVSLLAFLLWKSSLISGVAKNFLNEQLKPYARVEYQSLTGSLFNQIRLKNVQLTTKDSLLVKSNFVEIHYRLWPLLHNKVEISKLIFDQLEIFLPAGQPTEQSAVTSKASINFDSLLASWQKYVSIDTLLGSLPDIRLKNLEIISGQVHIAPGPLTFTHINILVSGLKLKRHQVYLKLDNISGRWPEKKLNLRSFSLIINGNSERIVLNQGELHSDHSHLYFNALLSPIEGLNINLTEFRLDLSEFRPLLGPSVPPIAGVQGTISFSGMPLHFGVEGQLKGYWATRRLDALQFQLRYNHGELFLDRFRLMGNFAQIVAKAYWNTQKQITGQAKFQRVNLHYFEPQLPFSKLNGQLSLDAENLNLRRLTGTAQLLLYHCQVDSFTIDSVRLNIKARKGFYHFNKPSFVKIADSSVFFVEGTLDRQLNINFDLFTFNNSLGQTLGALGLSGLKGFLDGRIHLQGPLGNPDFSGNLFVPHLRYQSVQLDTLKFNVFIQGLSRQRLGSGSFRIVSGKIDRFPIDRVSFDLQTAHNRVAVHNLTFLSNQNFFSTNIFLNWTPTLDSLNVKLFPFKVQYQNYWLNAKDTLTLTLNSRELMLESFTLMGPENSELTINGFYDFDLADFQGYLTLDQLEIAPFEQFLKSHLNFRGKVNGFVEVLTPFTDLSVQAELFADSLILQNIFLGRFSSDFYYAKNLFTINDFTLANDSTFLGLKGEFTLQLQEKKFNLLEDTQVDLIVDWEQLQLRHYAPLLKGIRRMRGVTSGEILITGQVDAPKIQGHLSLDDFNFDTFPGDSLRLAFHYDQERIHLDSLHVVLDGTSIKASGWQDYPLSLVHFDADILNKPFSLHLQSQDNQIFFLRNLIEEVESIQGPYQIDLQIAGTPLHPGIKSGVIRLENGQILLSIIRDPITKVNFDATISDYQLTINTCTAHSVEEKDFLEKLWRLVNSIFPWNKRSIREGYLAGHGTIDLRDLTRPRLDLSLKLDEFYVDYFIQNVKVLVTTRNLKITGRDTIFVSGDLYIPKGIVEIDLDQIARSVYLTEEVIKPEPPFLALNLNVEIPGNFTVTSSPLNLTNNFRIVFLGDLQITMEPPSDEPRILGHLEAISGKYASWNQNFIVQSATIDFKNKIPIDPDIDVIAIKQLGNKKFELALNGSVSNLNQQIRVFENGRELSLSAFDKIALLTLGADISTVQSNPDSALRDVGEKIATTSILTAVERGAEKFTGLDRVEINASGSLVNLSRFKLNNGLSDASIAFGKYLTSDLYIEYRTRFSQNIPAPRLSWDAGNRIGLQYRINRYWTLDSYYEKTERGNTRIRFGLNWEYSF